MAQTQSLGQAAFDIAARGACEYLKAHNLRADIPALTQCVRSWCTVKMPEALQDARAAAEIGMVDVAEQTFAATMVLAGIEAAKETGYPNDPSWS